MANYLCPWSVRQFFDGDAAYTGAKLFIYAAGSSTKVTTYKDSAGASSHSNPIILNARGEPADGAGASQVIWQAGGSAVKLVLAPANDTDPPASAISSWDNINGINDSSSSRDQWILGPTPTYVGATSFTLVGDHTSTFNVGRRIKTTNSGGTVYSTITVSAYTTQTDITVENDSGVLDSGLSDVSYALLSATNASIPGVLVDGKEWTHKGSVWIIEGSSVASAADCDVWATADGNSKHITGTDTISDWGTAPQDGASMWLTFDDATPLTYNATTNKLNTNGTNYTTVAGDRGFLEAETTTSFKLTIFPVNVNPYTLSGVSIALAATGTSDGSAASTAFVQQELGSIGAISHGIGTQKMGAINLSATATYFLPALGQTATGTEADASWYVNDAMTCSKLYASLSQAITTGTVTITVRKNGVGTGITCTLDSLNQNNSDLVNSFDINPGDYFSVRAATSGLDTATKDLKVSLVFKYKNSNVGAGFMSICTVNAGIGSRGGEPNCSGTDWPAGSELMFPAAVTGGIASYVAGNITVGESGTVKRTATATAPTTGQNPINTTPYLHSTTDYYYINRTVEDVSGCWSWKSANTPFVAVPGLMAFLSYNQAQGTTCYMQGYAPQTATTNEGNVSLPISAGVIKNLRCRASAAPPGVQTVILTVRKNGVDTGLTVTLNNANQYAFDLVNTVSFSAGDLLSISSVTSASTGTLQITATLEHSTS